MSLERENRLFQEMRGNLEHRYPGQYVVFYENEFLGPYKNLAEAAEAAAKWHGQGPYLIRCLGVDELQRLVDKITPENRHKEVDWGKPRGKEVW